MTDLALSQAWVSRVTKPGAPDISVIGVNQREVPSKEQLAAVLKSIAATDTAKEMVRRKWVQPKQAVADKMVERGEAIFAHLFGGGVMQPMHARFRGRKTGPKPNLIEEIATMAWLSHVSEFAHSHRPNVPFRATCIDEDFIRNLVKLSVHADGPARALNELRKIGISVVTESALPGMSVDGASLHPADLGPVLALTLRHDRLDNFWFTLLHEIGHIVLHLGSPSDEIFVDSIEDGAGDEVEEEAEANAFAKDGLIPRDAWMRSDAYRHASESSVVNLARQLGIHAAIVAGRVRYERREYRMLHHLVGQDEVRDGLLAG